MADLIEQLERVKTFLEGLQPTGGPTMGWLEILKLLLPLLLEWLRKLIDAELAAKGAGFEGPLTAAFAAWDRCCKLEGK